MRHRSNYDWMLFLTSPMAFVYYLIGNKVHAKSIKLSILIIIYIIPI